MFKNIKLYTVVGLSTLTLIGCGGSGSDNSNSNSSFVEKNTKAVTFNGLESLGSNTKGKDLSKSKVTKTYENYTKNDNSSNDSICTQGGSFSMDGGEKEKYAVIKFNNCKNDGENIDGSFKIASTENDQGMILSVLRDLSVDAQDISLFIAKDSMLKIFGLNSQTTTINTNFKSSIDGEELSANNFSISYTKVNEDGVDLSFKSGEINVGEYYFKIVPTKNRVFVLNNDGVQSGMLNLVDGAGHKIELEVINPNILITRIDENGDGSFSDSEISTKPIDENFFD
jgi:hypothetical protein